MKRRWKELDEDCLVTIFGMLPLEDLILAVPFVCTSWLKASLNPSLWRSLDLRCWDTMQSRVMSLPGTVDKAKRSFPMFLEFVVGRSQGSVISLQLPAKGVSGYSLIYLCNKCPDIKFIMFSLMANSCYTILPALIARWRKLEYLSLVYAPVDIPEIIKAIGRWCDNFKCLKVACVIGSKVPTAIVTHIPNVKALDLSEAVLLKENLNLILEGCKELEELNLMNSAVFDLDPEMLCRVKERVKSFRCEVYQWGSFNYIDETWCLTEVELNILGPRARRLHDVLMKWDSVKYRWCRNRLQRFGGT